MKKLLKEGSSTEFKSSFTDSVIESLVAFANTNGGRVLIGLNDKGKPVNGFSLGDETLQKWVNEVRNKTQPSIMKSDFEELPGGFLVTLGYLEQKNSTDIKNVHKNVYENVHENVHESLNGKLSNSKQKIVKAMQTGNKISMEELSTTLIYPCY